MHSYSNKEWNNQLKGYEHALQGKDPMETNLNYLNGFREGLELQVKWANENLTEFDIKFSNLLNVKG